MQKSSYYRETTRLLREAVRRIKGCPSGLPRPSDYGTVDMQRARLLEEIAGLQAEINDTGGLRDTCAVRSTIAEGGIGDSDSGFHGMGEPHMSLAVMLASSGEESAVEEVLKDETRLARYPEKLISRAISRAAVVAAQRGQQSHAGKLLDRLHRLAGDLREVPRGHVFVLGELAEAQIAIGRISEAEMTVASLMNRSPSSDLTFEERQDLRREVDRVLHRVAVALARAGERDLAVRVIKHGITWQPEVTCLGVAEQDVAAGDTGMDDDRILGPVSAAEPRQQMGTFLRIADSLSEIGYEVAAGLYLLQVCDRVDEMPRGREMFSARMAAVGARLGKTVFVTNPPDNRTCLEYARIRIAYAVYLGLHQQPDKAAKALLFAADLLSVSKEFDAIQGYRDLGRCCERSGLEVGSIGIDLPHALAEAAVLLGRADEVSEIESCAHAAEAGAVIFGDAVQSPSSVSDMPARLQECYAEGRKQVSEAGVPVQDSRPDKDGELLLLPMGNRLDVVVRLRPRPFAAALSLDVLGGDLESRRAWAQVVRSCIGETVRCRGLRIQKVVAVRPKNSIVLSIRVDSSKE